MSGPLNASYSHLLPPDLSRRMVEYLGDDIPSVDVGGAVVGDTPVTASLYAKTPAVVLAGCPFFDCLFEVLGCRVEWMPGSCDGVVVGPTAGETKVCVAKVLGPANRVLQGERTALEIISRCSGVATLSQRAVNIAQASGFKTRIAGTRKVTPGSFRLVEKYGLMVGGADTHRLDLSSMVMLKDNHIDACGGLTNAVRKARALTSFAHKIEVECRSENDAMEACAAGADIVMLDNFAPALLREVAARIKAAYPHKIIEASGGIKFDNITDYCSDSVDIISMGALTHGTPAVDFSLKIDIMPVGVAHPDPSVAAAASASSSSSLLK